MKTLTAPIPHEREYETSPGRQFLPYMGVSLRGTVAILSGLTFAITVVLLSVWASGSEEIAVLSASIWGISFIFLALAVDSQKSRAVLLLVTGLVLMTIAWLGSRVSPEFFILAGVILACWLCVGLYRALR